MNQHDLALTVACPHCPAQVGQRCNPGRTYRGRPTRTWSPHMGRVKLARESRDFTRQNQTRFGLGAGNCFSTCVACMFNLPTDEIPNFCVDYEDWWFAFLEWLRPRGYGAIDLPIQRHRRMTSKDWNALQDVTVIAGGPNVDGNPHAVLMRNGELVHDPNPATDGIVEIDDLVLLVPLRWPHEILCGGAS